MQTYRDFYVEKTENGYMATFYEPRHVIRGADVDEIFKKIDDYLKNLP